MSDAHPTPRDAAERMMDGELNADATEKLLDREGFCFQLLGIDSENRAVYYASDDGHIVWYEYPPEGQDLKQVSHTFIGPELDNDPERVDAFATAFAYLTTHGEDWTWTHPRFRWMADELKREQTA